MNAVGVAPVAEPVVQAALPALPELHRLGRQVRRDLQEDGLRRPQLLFALHQRIQQRRQRRAVCKLYVFGSKVELKFYKRSKLQELLPHLFELITKPSTDIVQRCLLGGFTVA